MQICLLSQLGQYEYGCPGLHATFRSGSELKFHMFAEHFSGDKHSFACLLAPSPLHSGLLFHIANKQIELSCGEEHGTLSSASGSVMGNNAIRVALYWRAHSTTNRRNIFPN